MFKQSYTYQDIGLVPTSLSTLKSRDDADTLSNFLDIAIELPLIVAPMRRVVSLALTKAIYNLTGVVILPHHEDFDEDKRIIREAKLVIPSIPVKGYQSRLRWISDIGLGTVCINTANGHHENLRPVMKMANELGMRVIAGNVGSVEGFKYLADLGVRAIRVGIGPGAGCTTSIATGIGMGQASLIREIAKSKHAWDTAIIADGGIKTPGDMVKAIALGADFVMAGFIFAGSEESPGQVIKFNNKKYKQYAGEASFAVKRSKKYVEGDETLVPYSGPVANTWHRFEDGLRSAMAYMNARTLDELRLLPDENFRLLSHSAKEERRAQ